MWVARPHDLHPLTGSVLGHCAGLVGLIISEENEAEIVLSDHPDARYIVVTDPLVCMREKLCYFQSAQHDP